MTGEYFRMRRLLWDELKLRIHSSEEEELRAAIGNYLIAENEELQNELATLVDILADFQQQNDNIRDALTKRQPMPEPPGRPLLLEKLKILASDLRVQSPRPPVQTPKEMEILEYVLSASDEDCVSTIGSHYPFDRGALSCRSVKTPRMADLQLSAEHLARLDDNSGAAIIPLRPGTSGGVRRPLTASSQRPVSRGSTASASSVSTLLESAELQQQLSVERVDSIKDDLQEALMEERQQILEDIDFIQGCLEMEKDLIDEDRKTVARPPPSLSELQSLGKTLEKSLEDQIGREEIEMLLSKPSGNESFRRSSRSFYSETTYPTLKRETEAISKASVSCLPPVTSGRRDSRTRVLKIRHEIQEARDEPYLS